jgi:hypothetical protein
VVRLVPGCASGFRAARPVFRVDGAPYLFLGRVGTQHAVMGLSPW